MDVRSLSDGRPDWLLVLGPLVVVLFAAGFVTFRLHYRNGIATDPAFFQHTGWYVLEGAVPYLDVWDVNPPVPFAVTAVLAALSGGNMLALHGLSVALTVSVAVASVLLVGWIARHLTGSDAAAVAAGLTMLVVPEIFILPLEGVRAQFYALFFGVGALALVLRDRPFLGGVLAALAAGSWQSGVAFAPLVVGVAYQRGGRTGGLRSVAGGGAVTAVVVATFAAVGALVPMIVQTVIAPLNAGSPYTLTERAFSILLVFGYGSALVPVAVLGWVDAAVRDLERRWWLLAGGLLLGFQVLFVDLDGATDALPWLAFVALGVAVVVERAVARRSAAAPSSGRSEAADRRAILAVVAVVGLLVAGGFAWNLSSPAPQSTLRTMEEEASPDASVPLSPDDADVPSMQTIYWDQLEPDTCHYRLSWNELRWVSSTDDRLDRERCDGWPSRVDSG